MLFVMGNDPASHAPTAGLKCPKCKYALTGLPRNICPECGTPFNPAALRNARRRMWIPAIILTLLIVYAPFSWLSLVNSDPTYVRFWMMRWPVLPGLAPTFLILAPFNTAPGHLPEWLSLLIMGLISLAIVLAISWLASRSVRWLIIVCLIAAGLSVFNSWVAWNIFAA